jgi:hypothetical protein
MQKGIELEQLNRKRLKSQKAKGYLKEARNVNMQGLLEKGVFEKNDHVFFIRGKAKKKIHFTSF